MGISSGMAGASLNNIGRLIPVACKSKLCCNQLDIMESDYVPEAMGCFQVANLDTKGSTRTWPMLNRFE